MKWLKRLLIIFVLLMVVCTVVIAKLLGPIIKTGVETIGSQVAGVPITLEHARVSPFRGGANLKGLVVGNPEGYKSPSAFELGEVDVKVNLASLTTDTIEVERIHIKAPAFTYEGSLKGSNISKLLEQLESEEKPEPQKETTPVEEKSKNQGPGKKVVINDFLLADATVKLTLKELGGKTMDLTLPQIHLTDIGKNSAGASLQEDDHTSCEGYFTGPCEYD